MVTWFHGFIAKPKTCGPRTSKPKIDASFN